MNHLSDACTNKTHNRANLVPVSDSDVMRRVKELQRGIPQLAAYWAFVSRELTEFNAEVRARCQS